MDCDWYSKVQKWEAQSAYGELCVPGFNKLWIYRWIGQRDLARGAGTKAWLMPPAFIIPLKSMDVIFGAFPWPLSISPYSAAPFPWVTCPRLPTFRIYELLQKMLWHVSHFCCQNVFTLGWLLMFLGLFSLNKRGKPVPGSLGNQGRALISWF